MKPWTSWQQEVGGCTMWVRAGPRAVVTGEALAAGLRMTSSAMLLVALTWKPRTAAPAMAKARHMLNCECTLRAGKCDNAGHIIVAGGGAVFRHQILLLKSAT